MAGTSESKSLKDLLAEQLPKGLSLTFYHYSTPPSKSSAIFSAPPNGRPERTYCESHFLAASIIPPDSARFTNAEELLVLAVEVLIYSTRNLTTIFVSKADSTGCLAELKLPRSQSGSPLKAICGTFVKWLAKERQRDGKKVVISLFARAQDQYLFPASIENKDKHVLDDRDLVKWWCRVLDPIVWSYEAQADRKSFADRLAEPKDGPSSGTSEHATCTAKGYLVIPGFETYDTLRYTPLPAAGTARRWTAAHPLREISSHPAAPPRCLVPHFPDDPKARFLDELDEELPDRSTDAVIAQGGTPSRSNGQWKSVKTLEQFWEFMAFRQECSSGRIVGFIWVVITPPKSAILEEDEDPQSQHSTQPLSQYNSQEKVPHSKKRQVRSKRKDARTSYGTIPLVLPKIKSTSSNLSSTSNTSTGSNAKLPPSSSPYYVWPESSRGTICFSTKNYDRAHEVLLQQSFANRAGAARSTKKWKEEIGVLGGVDNWSWTVTGQKEAPVASERTTNGITPTMVMGVKKKRKPTASVDLSSTSQPSEPVQTLGAGLVRKKAKVEPTCVSSTVSCSDVQTLSAGLVRKKPKA